MCDGRQAMIEAWIGEEITRCRPDLAELLRHVLFRLEEDELAAVLAHRVRLGAQDCYRSHVFPGEEIVYRESIERTDHTEYKGQTTAGMVDEVLHELAHAILGVGGSSHDEDMVRKWVVDNTPRFLPYPP